MNLTARTEPLVNELRGEFLRTPGGDIEVSLERLKLDMRYGSFSRDFFRLFAMYFMIFLQEGTIYA